MPEQRFVLSIRSLLWILGAALVLVLLWQLQSLLITFMVAFVLAAAIAPLVEWAEQRNLPRWLAVILVYLTLIVGLILSLLWIGPTVLTQIEGLIRQIPVYSQSVIALSSNWLGALSDSQSELMAQFLNTEALNNWALQSGQQFLSRSYDLTKGLVGGIVGGFVGLILTLLISGYMVADSKTLVDGLMQLLPHPWDERLRAQLRPVSQRMGAYIRGRLLTSGLVGVFITAGLIVLGLPEVTLGLGTIAGITNLIPFLGSILGATPALLVALSDGGSTFLWVLLLFFFAQNLEAYILGPLMAGATSGIHPLYQLLAALGGAQVLGIVGAIVVPPLIARAAALIENLYLQPKRLTEQQVVVTSTLSSSAPEFTSLSQK